MLKLTASNYCSRTKQIPIEQFVKDKLPCQQTTEWNKRRTAYSTSHDSHKIKSMPYLLYLKVPHPPIWSNNNNDRINSRWFVHTYTYICTLLAAIPALLPIYTSITTPHYQQRQLEFILYPTTSVLCVYVLSICTYTIYYMKYQSTPFNLLPHSHGGTHTPE